MVGGSGCINFRRGGKRQYVAEDLQMKKKHCNRTRRLLSRPGKERGGPERGVLSLTCQTLRRRTSAIGGGPKDDYGYSDDDSGGTPQGAGGKIHFPRRTIKKGKGGIRRC